MKRTILTMKHPALVNLEVDHPWDLFERVMLDCPEKNETKIVPSPLLQDSLDTLCAEQDDLRMSLTLAITQTIIMGLQKAKSMKILTTHHNNQYEIFFSGLREWRNKKFRLTVTKTNP